jgi:hypothetical protein
MSNTPPKPITDSPALPQKQINQKFPMSELHAADSSTYNFESLTRLFALVLT